MKVSLIRRFSLAAAAVIVLAALLSPLAAGCPRAYAGAPVFDVTVAPVTGGKADVITDAVDGQAAAGDKVTISIIIPANESQYNHRLKSVAVTAAGGTPVPVTEVDKDRTCAFTMPACAVTVAVALEIAPLEVYVQAEGSAAPVLVHSYTQDELEALSITEPQYYTGIDSMPSVVQGKGTGVLLGVLLEDLTQYDPRVTFGEGAALKLTSADRYTATYTYDYLLGAERYYYPELTDLTNISTGGAAVIEPMLAVTSFQGRNLTCAELDACTPDTATAYRFCFGLLPSDVAATKVTVNRFAKWVNRIDIIESAAGVTDSNLSNIAITTAAAAAPDKAASSGTSPWLWTAIAGGVIIVGLVVALVVRKTKTAGRQGS